MTGFPWLKTMTVALLMAGNTIGAGILGLPVTTGLVGAWPSLAAMAVVWLLMLATGWIIARGVIRLNRPGLDLVSLFDHSLGRWGGVTTTVVYLALYYSLQVAYLTGAGAVMGQLFGAPEYESWFMVGFFILSVGLIMFGMDLVRRSNALLMALLGAAFIVLLFTCVGDFDPARMERTDLVFLPGTLPILVMAFAFHNIIPASCHDLELKSGPINTAMALGTGLALVMSAAWTVLVLGALPVESPDANNLMHAYNHGQPATVPLAGALKSKVVTIAGIVFSLVAILTSFVAMGTGLVGFVTDLLNRSSVTRGLSANRPLNTVISFGPPLAVAILFPELFLGALNLVGGVFNVILFGILPGLLLIKGGAGNARGLKIAGAAVALVFGLLLVLEMLQEAGWLIIRPDVNHWIVSLPI